MPEQVGDHIQVIVSVPVGNRFYRFSRSPRPWLREGYQRLHRPIWRAAPVGSHVFVGINAEFDPKSCYRVSGV